MRKIYNIELYDEIHQKLVKKLNLDYVIEKEQLDTFLEMAIEDVMHYMKYENKDFSERKQEYFIRELFKKNIVIGLLRARYQFKKMGRKTEKYYNKQYKKRKKIIELMSKS